MGYNEILAMQLTLYNKNTLLFEVVVSLNIELQENDLFTITSSNS
ncbi:11997_t:CDS:1, partial [Funneliformis mosseae]